MHDFSGNSEFRKRILLQSWHWSLLYEVEELLRNEQTCLEIFLEIKIEILHSKFGIFLRIRSKFKRSQSGGSILKRIVAKFRISTALLKPTFAFSFLHFPGLLTCERRNLPATEISEEARFREDE